MPPTLKLTIIPILCTFILSISACQAAAETALPTPEAIVKECTAEGCGTSLSISLVGEVPADFVMLAHSPGSPPLEVRCVGREGQYSQDHFQQASFMTCQGDKVEIVNFYPPSFTITVDSSGRSVSQDFTPRYELVYPNGPDCDPECPVAAVVFEMKPLLSFEPAAYRDESAGFEFFYPAGWTAEGPQVVGERGYIAQFTSYPPAQGEYPDPPLEGSTQLQAAVMSWDPKGDLDAYINQRKQGWALSGNEVLAEQQHVLAGDLRAASFVIDSFGTKEFFLLAALGDKYLVISGQGDTDLVQEIALTLRLLE